MNQTALSILLGLIAGAGGALAVHFVGGGAKDGGSSSAGVLTDDSAIEARLDRIESMLSRGGTLTAEPSLRGSGATSAGAGASGGDAATVEAIVAQLEERLKPMVQESVKSGLQQAMEDGGSIGTTIGIKEHKKKKVTLAEAAAELQLTREEEDAVRRIAGETTNEFFKILAGKDKTVEDVRREFEDARNDPQKRLGLTTKYMGKAFSDIGALISLGLNHQSKMKKAVGSDKAAKIESSYQITDLDPYGLEDMFQFD